MQCETRAGPWGGASSGRPVYGNVVYKRGGPQALLLSRSVNRAPGCGLRAGWAVSGGAAGADHGQNVAAPAPDQGRYPDEQAQPQLEGVVDDEGKRDEADAAAEGEAG